MIWVFGGRPMSSPHSCIASHSPLARSKLLLYDCSAIRVILCVFTIPALAHKKKRQEFRKNSVAPSERVLVFFPLKIHCVHLHLPRSSTCKCPHLTTLSKTHVDKHFACSFRVKHSTMMSPHNQWSTCITINYYLFHCLTWIKSQWSNTYWSPSELVVSHSP